MGSDRASWDTGAVAWRAPHNLGGATTASLGILHLALLRTLLGSALSGTKGCRRENEGQAGHVS